LWDSSDREKGIAGSLRSCSSIDLEERRTETANRTDKPGRRMGVFVAMGALVSRSEIRMQGKKRKEGRKEGRKRV